MSRSAGHRQQGRGGGGQRAFTDLFQRSRLASFPKGDFLRAGDVTSAVVRRPRSQQGPTLAVQGPAATAPTSPLLPQSNFKPSAPHCAGPHHRPRDAAPGGLRARRQQRAPAQAVRGQPGRRRQVPVPAAAPGARQAVRCARRCDGRRPRPAPPHRQQPACRPGGGAHEAQRCAGGCRCRGLCCTTGDRLCMRGRQVPAACGRHLACRCSCQRSTMPGRCWPSTCRP